MYTAPQCSPYRLSAYSACVLNVCVCVYKNGMNYYLNKELLHFNGFCELQRKHGENKLIN